MSFPNVKLKSSMDSFIVSLFAILTLTSSCDAFFRNLMIGFTEMSRIDPIVNRGSAAMHVHHLNGGSSLDFDSTGETLSASSCTNSILTQDKSAYWAPWLYFQHQNGSLSQVNLAMGLTAYYKYEERYNTGGKVKYSVFPKGLKMLSGDTNKRTWTGPWPVPEESIWGKADTTQAALQEKAMGFNCMNYEAGKNEPSFAYPWLRNKEFLDANCKNGIRAEIIFPSCWDGKNLDSSDHKSHLAFPTLIQDGVCPDTHPVYLPILFYETIWNTNEFKDFPGQFVFSNGDPTGYGYHADFIAAWDDGVQEAVKENTQCTYLGSSGQVEDCPVFAGKIQSNAQAAECKLPSVPQVVAKEQVNGLLSALPGGVKIVGQRHDPGTGTGTGTDTSESYAPTVSVSKTRSSATATTSKIGSSIGSSTGAPTGWWHSEVTSVTSLPASAALSTPGVPVAPSPTTFSKSYSKPPFGAPGSRTTTYTSGRYVVQMVVVEMTETVTASTAPVITHTVVLPDNKGSDLAGRSRRERHIKKHAHNHGHLLQHDRV